MPLKLNANLSEHFERTSLDVNKPERDDTAKLSQALDKVNANFNQTINHQIPYEVNKPNQVEIEHQIPYENPKDYEEGVNNLTSDFQKALSNLESKQLEDNSNLNIDATPQIIDFILNSNANGFTPFQNQSEFKPDTSQLGPNNSNANYIANINAIGFTRNQNSLNTLYDVNSSQLGPNDSSVNFIEDRNAPGFTRNVNLLQTLYDVNSSQLGPNNETANWITDINATGFTRNAIPLQTLYDVNSSRLGPNEGSVNYFTDRNAVGFTRNTPLLVTLYDVNSSQLGPNNDSANWIVDANARGFTRGFNGPPTLYDVNSSELGPNNDSANWFLNINNEGFTRNVGLETQFKVDTSQLGPNEGSNNYFADINNIGFTRNVGKETQFKPDTTNLGANTRDANYIIDLYGAGFIRNFSTTVLDHTKSDLSIINDKQEINFIIDDIAQGFNAQVRIGDTKLDASKSDLSKISEIDYFANFNNEGFIRQFESTTLKPNTTQLAWGGGSANAPNTPNFIKFFTDTVLTDLDSNLNSDNTPEDYLDIARQSDLGPLGTYAITRRSPSPLDEQYQKFNLRRDSFNPDYIKMPYILRGIQNGLEPERWGGYAEIDGLSDISPFGWIDYKLAHFERMGKFQLSGRGLINALRQTGLQRMNPAVENDGGILDTITGRPTWVYNPLSTVRGGVRHGLSLLGRPQDAPGRYEDVVKEKNDNTPLQTDGQFSRLGPTNNRLTTLYDEMFVAPSLTVPTSLNIFGEGGAFGFLGALANNIIDGLIETAFPGIFNQDKIFTLSTNNGGPDSLMGIGPTIITRRVDSRSGIPGKVYNTDISQYASGIAKSSTSLNLPATSKTNQQDISNNNRLSIDTKWGNRNWVDFLTGKLDYLRIQGAGIDPDFPVSGDINTRLRQYVSSLASPKSATSSDDIVSATKDNIDENPNSLKATARPSANITNQFASSLSIKPDLLSGKASSRTAGDDAVKRNPFTGEPTLTEKNEGTDLSDSYKSILEDVNSKFKDSDKNFKHRSDPTNGDDTLKRYTTLAYGQIPQLDRSVSKFNDFRENFDSETLKESRNHSIDPAKLDDNYSKNIHQKKWVPDFGKINRDKSDPYNSAVQLPWGGENPITYKIGGRSFKAINIKFDINQNQSWNSIKMIGRADPVYMFDGVDRSGTTGFTIVVESLADLNREIRRLNQLRAQVTPTYNIEILREEITLTAGQTPKHNALTNAPITTLQIGDFYYANIAVDSIGVTIDDDMGWNIDRGAQLPRKIGVTLSFKEIMNLGSWKDPETGKTYYGYGQFGNKTVNLR